MCKESPVDFATVRLLELPPALLEVIESSNPSEYFPLPDSITKHVYKPRNQAVIEGNGHPQHPNEILSAPSGRSIQFAHALQAIRNRWIPPRPHGKGVP